MLTYSACNKFYIKEIIDSYGIAFYTDCKFGEDRLFNYSFMLRASFLPFVS
ncbi:MAG: hypothetical protein K6F28_04235 [Lachnospiraceae bacterium]|nr:hypothetical protein [Lachnospiraceae bacterium]